MEKTLSATAKLKQVLIERGSVVRFIWGNANIPELDTHPLQTERPCADGDTFLRVERQVIRRIPEHPACIFTIRVTTEPVLSVQMFQSDAQSLASALRSMDDKN